MVDREQAGSYSFKPTKDREVETEEKEEMNFGGFEGGSKTPIVRDTPIVKVGSYYAKSSYYGGMSPSFNTPIYNYSQR